MNATINGIIDVLFKDTVDNAETRALHEELLNNCLEHYQDLLDRGLSETEAIDAVVESLKGMKEVIDEYPKKSKPAGEETIEVMNDAETVQQPEQPEQPEKPDEKDRAFSADGITAIHTELKSSDLEITRSSDSLIHVRCDVPEQIICETNGGKLTVRYSDVKGHQFSDEMKPDDLSLKGIFSFVGKVLNKVAVEFTNGSKVFIDIPDERMDEMTLNSMSGNITMNDCAVNRVSIHSTSGDIRVSAGLSGKMKRFTASSASGDISYTGNADQAEANSISGDVTLEGDFLSVQMKSTSGDNELNGCAQRITMSSISGDDEIRIRNADAEWIDASSTSGDIDIELPDGISGVQAVMKSVSGDTYCRYADAGNGAGLKIKTRTVSGDIRIE